MNDTGLHSPDIAQSEVAKLCRLSFNQAHSLHIDEIDFQPILTRQEKVRIARSAMLLAALLKLF